MINIRKLLTADLPAVIAIEQAGQLFPWSENLFQSCFNEHYHCWVLERDSIIQGFIITTQQVDEWEIQNICVHPRARRLGFGRKLLKFAIDQAKSSAPAKIFLEVRESNRIAIQLYESLGFVKTHVRKQYYAAGNGREDGVVMEL